MNETPNFESYKSRFKAFILPSLTEDPQQPLPENEKALVERAYTILDTYFSEDDFRKTLTTARKNNIEGQINGVLDQFQQLQTLLAQPNTLTPNLVNISNTLQSYLEELDMRFWLPYQTHLLKGDTELSSHVAEIKKAAREAADAKNKAENILNSAGLIVSGGAEREVANYYQRSVNGLSITQHDKMIEDEKPMSAKSLTLGIVALAFFSILGAMLFTEAIDKFNSKSVEHYFYLAGGIGLLMAYPSYLYYEKLNRTQPSGYQRAASLWIIGAVLSVAATGIYASTLLNNFSSGTKFTDIIPSIVSLLAPAYLIRFCVQNYKANKHIATINQQKVIIARSYLAYLSNLENSDESLKVPSYNRIGEIQRDVANVLFDPGISGYINEKGSGGTVENIFQGTPLDGQVNR